MSDKAAAGIRTARSEHPWERARRFAFGRWEAEVRRAPYGRTLPDVVGFVSTIEPPPHWSDPTETRRLFAFSALPTGSSATYLAAVPPRQRRPEEGTLVRISRPEKRAMPASDAAYGELVFEARGGTTPASWQEIIGQISPPAPGNVVAQLSELWRLPPTVIETLLVPLMGSIPWHGRPIEVDLDVEVEGWPLARYRSFLSGLLDLAPEWAINPRRAVSARSREIELVSGARIRRPSVVAPPFSIRLRAVSVPPPGPSRIEARSRSTITFGKALASEFEATLSAGHIPLLLSTEEMDRVPCTPVEMPDALRASVWALHWGTPEVPETPDWYQWLRAQEPRLRRALDDMPIFRPNPSTDQMSAMVDRREFRDRLAQTAFAWARLRGASEVEEEDLVRTVDAIVRAIQRATAWAREGRGPLSRVLDRTEGGRTRRLRHTLEGLFHERTEGLTLEEALATLRTTGAVATPWDVENQLERLRILGLLFQDRSGRYKMA